MKNIPNVCKWLNKLNKFWYKNMMGDYQSGNREGGNTF